MGRKAEVDVYVNNEKAKARLAEIGDELKKLKLLKDKFLQEGNASGVDSVNKEMKKLNGESVKLSKNITDVNAVLKNLSAASIQELNAALRVASRELNQMKRSDPGFSDQEKKVSSLRAELDKATGKAKEHQSTMGKLANGFNKYFAMASAMVASLTGIIFGFRAAAEAADNFEKRLDVLSSLTGLEGKELEYLSEEAKKLSVSTIEGNIRITESADKIVDAYTKVGSARSELLKNKEDLNAVTQETMILAAAADSELQPAVESLAGVLNQFNYKASESRRIINTIAAGSKEGAGEIPYLTEAIEKSGTVAKDAGIEIEELVGIIETMAPRMASPEMAGRSLRGVILKLQQGADDTNPAIVGFSKAMDNLAAKNLSAAQMVELFGIENITAAKILMNNREEMNKYTQAVTGTNVALEQAAKNTDNNISKKAQARNELKLITMELGDKLSPALIVSTNGFTYLIKAIMAGIQIFNEHAGVIVTSTTAVIAYTTATKLATLWTERKTAGTIINTVVTKANTLAKGAAIMATQLFAAAQMLLTGNIKGAAQAMRVFNSVLKASPLGAAVATIAAITIGMIMYIRRQQELSQGQRSLNNVQEATNKTLDDQSSKLKNLETIVKNNNISLNKRREALEELKKIVPAYNASLTDEGRLINDNTKAIKEYLIQLEKETRFKAAREELEDLYKKKRIAERELTEAQRDLRISEQLNSQSVMGGGGVLHSAASQYVDVANKANIVNNILQKNVDLQKSISLLNKEIETTSFTSSGSTQIVDDAERNIKTLTKLEEELGKYKEILKNVEIGSAEFVSTQRKIVELEKQISTATGKNSGNEIKKDLQIDKKLQKSELDIMKDGYDKKLAMIKSGYDLERKAIETELKTNKKLTADQKADLNKVLINLEFLQQKDIEELNKEWSIKTLNHDKEIIQLKIESVEKESIEEIELRKTLLQKNLEIEIASLEGTEEQKAEKKEILSKKYAFELAEIEQEQSKKYLDDQLKQDIQTLTENHRKKLEELKKRYDEGGISLKEYNKERKKIEQEYTNESLKIAIDKAEKELAIIKASGEDITQAEAALAEMRLKLQENQGNTGKKESEGSDWEDWSDQERIDFAIDSAQQIADAQFKIAQEKNQRELDDKLNKLDQQREKELSNKKLTEDQKEVINKKYDAKARALHKAAWDKQHKADLASAWINLALSIGRAANNAWPVPAIPMMAAAAITGGLQIAQIAKQKNPYKSGGFTERSMSNDTPAGEVHANEFVANAQATKNPSVRKVLNIIDYAQKTGSIRTINLPAIIASADYERKLKAGGYVTSSTSSQILPGSNNDIFVLAMNRFSDSVEKFQEKGIKVEADARLVYQDFKKMKKKDDDAISLTS